MSFFGSLFGGLLGVGASALNGAINTAYSKELQEHQGAVNYKYAEKTARNNPSWNRAGLESAGYNPMLAVQNATSGANAGWTSGNTVTGSDISGDAGNFISNAQSFQRLENETNQTNSNIEANQATARNQNAEASNREAENPFISKREQANIGRLSAETSKLQRETEYFDALEKNLEEMRRINELGVNLNYKSSIYGSNQSYNAQTYSANKAYEANSIKSASQYLGKYMDDSIKKFGKHLGNSKAYKDVQKLRKYFKPVAFN